jgi:hypothetical protein
MSLKNHVTLQEFPFFNWLLQNVHEGVVDPELVFIINDTCFYFSDDIT